MSEVRRGSRGCGCTTACQREERLWQSPTSGLEENVAGLLCYVLGWVTGLIFFLIDKRPFVKFHAAQSIVHVGCD